MDLNWDDLRIFLAAARTGSFTAAAKALRVDQSTVSRRIAALEETLGAPLFVRHRDGLAKTPAAEALMQHATNMEVEAATALRAGREKHVTGVVNVAMTDGLAFTLLQSGFGTLAMKLPGVCIHLITGNRVVDLARSEVDLALRLVRPREASLSIRKVGQLVFAMHAAPHYLAQRGAPQSVAELAGHDIIGVSGELSSSPLGKWLDGLVGVRIAMRASSVPVLGMAVAAGMGLGILPISWRQPGQQLERLFLVEELEPRPIWLVSHQASKSAAVNAVAEMIAQLVHQLMNHEGAKKG